MKKLLFLPFILIFSSISVAQIIDDSSVDLAQNGYDFVEGQFVAYLADTVTPGFVEKAFRELEIPILDMQIEPLVISIVNQPSDKSLKALKEHPEILSMHTMVDKASMQQMIKAMEDNGWTEEQIEEAKSNSPEMEMYIIRFNYSVNERKAKVIMGNYRDVAYKVLINSYRTVTLKAKEGEEPILMDKVDQLAFVEGTAMVGSIKN